MFNRIALGSILVFSLAIVGCSSDEEEEPQVDAAPEVDAEPQPAVDCATYCETVTTNCEGDYAQYADQAQCESWCGSDGLYWEVGAEGDTDVNTVACRLYHAEAAADDPGTHCVHAGPTGGGMCGTVCENYCAIMEYACSDDFTNDYTDYDGCLDACGQFATGEIGDTAGDTAECRLYHAGAALGDAATHCPHAKSTPDDMCVAQ